ncbi:MAG TPA: 2-oxoglutarate dehydrogenase E1 component, partial [Gemmatimonadaceae bacterium]|nr:2-oxoglutarate dehydrogenase E1 component [Gemmatimonadaceae bacterium]
MSGLPISSAFNDGYIAEAYEAYRRDPAAVDESWRQYFRFAESLGGATPAAGGGYDADMLRKAAGAGALVAAIRRYGHYAVPIDPLGTPPHGAAELTPEYHGITEADLRDVPATALRETEGTAADVVAKRRAWYCGGLAYEFVHVSDEHERLWIRAQIEQGTFMAPLTPDEKRALLGRLTAVDGFERFLGLAFVNAKRFSIEGVDALVPVIDEAITRAVGSGARTVVLGLAHRGRLNVLRHVMGKPAGELFAEFAGERISPDPNRSGDVKYHLGYRSQRQVGDRVVDLELVPNPSHLELVNPVMMGVARALQRDPEHPGTHDEQSVLPICVHGDAAFPGEGVVAETFNLALLRGYRVGGTLHLITNNQVGFTTDPTDARSTHYASDLAKGFEVPIVHVNADDLEACIQAVRLAMRYRDRFHKDFLIDLVGYRRHGHNEADQPAFTQPRMYEIIKTHPTAREVWAARLVRERVVTEAEVQAMDRAVADQLGEVFKQVKAKHDEPDAPPPEALPPRWEHPETAVAADRLAAFNEEMLTWPDGFKLHPTLQRTLARRRDGLRTAGIDWGHAESLAFASLLVEGTGVRLSGQDAERGTFSHRQAVLHDVDTGGTYTPLAHLKDGKAPFEIYNSPLSEMAVMGFEYGFSAVAPGDLTLWEAQYGDFANVAQPIVDQFLSASHSKWGQDSGLVLLLPHGYEGQGPEHSSARLERYLQLAAEDNMSVAYPSTPAQYFHALRRQALRTMRRPLVLIQPKSLLRLAAAMSHLEALSDVGFRPVLDDPAAQAHREDVRRIVFCTGKLYYDVVEARAKAGDEPGVALVRVEELAPWPHEAIAAVVDAYPHVEDIVWAQEEPRNMGAWTYVSPRLRASTGTQVPVRYVGRAERASPAEGYSSSHAREQGRIVSDALTLAPAG